MWHIVHMRPHSVALCLHLTSAGVTRWCVMHGCLCVLGVTLARLQDARTALMAAVESKSEECVRALLGAEGVDVNITDEVGDVGCA